MVELLPETLDVLADDRRKVRIAPAGPAGPAGHVLVDRGPGDLLHRSMFTLGRLALRR